MQRREQFQLCPSDTENLRQSAETPEGAEETVEKSKLNSSCEAEEKITVRITN